MVNDKFVLESGTVKIGVGRKIVHAPPLPSSSVSHTPMSYLHKTADNLTSKTNSPCNLYRSTNNGCERRQDEACKRDLIHSCCKGGVKNVNKVNNVAIIDKLMQEFQRKASCLLKHKQQNGVRTDNFVTENRGELNESNIVAQRESENPKHRTNLGTIKVRANLPQKEVGNLYFNNGSITGNDTCCTSTISVALMREKFDASDNRRNNSIRQIDQLFRPNNEQTTQNIKRISSPPKLLDAKHKYSIYKSLSEVRSPMENTFPADSNNPSDRQIKTKWPPKTLESIQTSTLVKRYEENIRTIVEDVSRSEKIRRRMLAPKTSECKPCDLEVKPVDSFTMQSGSGAGVMKRVEVNNVPEFMRLMTPASSSLTLDSGSINSYESSTNDVYLMFSSLINQTAGTTNNDSINNTKPTFESTKKDEKLIAKRLSVTECPVNINSSVTPDYGNASHNQQCLIKSSAELSSANTPTAFERKRAINVTLARIKEERRQQQQRQQQESLLRQGYRHPIVNSLTCKSTIEMDLQSDEVLSSCGSSAPGFLSAEDIMSQHFPPIADDDECDIREDTRNHLCVESDLESVDAKYYLSVKSEDKLATFDTDLEVEPNPTDKEYKTLLGTPVSSVTSSSSPATNTSFGVLPNQKNGLEESQITNTTNHDSSGTTGSSSNCSSFTGKKLLYSSKGTVRGVHNKVYRIVKNFIDLNLELKKKLLTSRKVVIYTTTCTALRDTYHQSERTKSLLGAMNVKYVEKDCYINLNYTKELKALLSIEPSASPPLPQIFIDSQHLGSYKELEQLNEAGFLHDLLERYKTGAFKPRCTQCGDLNYILCPRCHGGKRSSLFNSFSKSPLKCVHCEETGLVKCDDCDINR